MNTAYHFDEKNKQLSPVPANLVGMIRNDVFNEKNGLGFFCTGIYDCALELADLQERGFAITDGGALRATILKALGSDCTSEDFAQFMSERYEGRFTAAEYLAFVRG